MPLPNRLHLRQGRCLWSALGFLVPGVLALTFTGLAVAEGGIEGVLVCTAILGAILTGLGVLHLGIVAARPVGLRMDSDGLSGFYVAPLMWRDIRAVDLYWRDPHTQHSDDHDPDAPPDRKHLYLSLRLRDDKSWWIENTRMQRLMLLLRGKAKGWDVLIPLGPLDVQNPKEVVHTAARFHEGL